MNLIYMLATYSWLLIIGTPGDVTLLQCDGSMKKVGYNHVEWHVTWKDIEWSADITISDKSLVIDIMTWAESCRSRPNGCIVGDHYDPLPPEPDCPLTS